MPEDAKGAARDFFLGAVERRVYELAADPNVDTNVALSQQGYSFAAKELVPQFAALVSALQGKPAPQPAAVPAGQPAAAAGVRPLVPGTGGGSPPPPVPKGKYSMANLDKNVADYVGQTAVRI